MLYNGIGAHHQKILPKILPRSDSEVDMLLDGKLRVYVELAYYAYKSYWSYFAYWQADVRSKRNSMDNKEIALISTGFQAFIHNIFWYLPFSNMKQVADFFGEKGDKWRELEVLAEGQRAWPGQMHSDPPCHWASLTGPPVTRGQSCCTDAAQAYQLWIAKKY